MSRETANAHVLICVEDGCERRLYEHHGRNQTFKPVESDLDRLSKSEYLKYLQSQRERDPQVDPVFALATRQAAGLTQQEVADGVQTLAAPSRYRPVACCLGAGDPSGVPTGQTWRMDAGRRVRRGG